MSQKFTRLLFLCLSSLCYLGGSAQGFLTTDGPQIVDERGEPYLLKGMGLGGWMLQEGYMLHTPEGTQAQYQIRNAITELIGEARTQEFYDAWLANGIREVDIEKMHESGFNSVRLPMHYNLYTLPIEEEPVEGEQTWLNTGLVLTDSLIAWCKRRDMYVVLDLHAAPGGQGDDVNISDRDTTKPSLWESQANKDKTVALWHRLAERYADEPTVAGYDLINETNYDLDLPEKNIALRELFIAITDTIRSVDRKHMIIIEGNGFANDFTNITPPWDSNLVYSPHKYWNYNDQSSIQYALDIRDEFNVPIYYGETGENSNVWFRNAAKLFQDNNIGWAWWPWKKVDAIAGPVSVPRPEGYNDLLSYWAGDEGAEAPSADEAYGVLMALAEGFKLENARFQKDVIDALFRQVDSDGTVAWTEREIPGLIHASEFDLGRNEYAYNDLDTGNYFVSIGGPFTAWNSGFAFRNDAVDIEASQDTLWSNGYNVAYTSDSEWMQYTTTVTEPGVYEARVRVATPDDGSKLHFQVGESELSAIQAVPGTGGYQNWTTMVVEGIVLTEADEKLRLYVDVGNFNIGGMYLVQTPNFDAENARFVSGKTIDNSTVRITLSKPLNDTWDNETTGFELSVNGVVVPATRAPYDPDRPRSVDLVTPTMFRSTDSITVSYSGIDLQATDSTTVSVFFNQPVANNASVVYRLPGRLEAENFAFQVGVQTEPTTDEGGGQNIGFLDPGDYLDYSVSVADSGTYKVDFRNASETGTGGARLDLVGEDGGLRELGTVAFEITGGWQTWVTNSTNVDLPAGDLTLRLTITAAPFNLNYMDFSNTSPTRGVQRLSDVRIYPNPTSGLVTISGALPTSEALTLQLVDVRGRVVREQRVARQTDRMQLGLDVSTLLPGVYTVRLHGPVSGTLSGGRIVKR